MLIDHFLKRLISVKQTATVDECMSLMTRMRTPFLGVVDDNHAYLGTVSIYDVMNLRPEIPLLKQDIIKDTFATIEPDTPPATLLRLALANPGGCFAVVGSDKICRGLVFAGDVLKWHVKRKNEEHSFANASLKTLGYGYCIASETEVLYASDSFYEILQMSCDKALFPQELPGREYIRRSLTSGSCFTDLEVSHKNSILLMSVAPCALQNQKSPSNVVMVIFGDTSRIRHYVVLQTIFGSMREGVNIVDEYGIVNYCNPSSAHYVNATPDTLIGASITKYYSKAVLLKVLKTHESYFDERLAFDGRVFIVNAVPLFVGGVFKGGIATFREITDIIQLTNRLASMEEQINSMQIELNMNKYSDVFQVLVGCDGSLKATIEKAQRCIAALGGPRHCIITGETGTGKTTLAKSMFYFAKKIEVIQSSAPFIEVNCAQFTNPDIAAMEIFGSEKGSYTGATDRMGLIELANGGILFLDEAHALGPYQTMLLKVIEQGILRRIGGRTDKKVDVIIIAASTKNLQESLIPELYQRLAQYQVFLPPLRLKPRCEKKAMMQTFCRQYEQYARERYHVDLKLTVSEAAETALLSAYYPRNIRQFRDVVNSAIDTAVPPVFTIRDQQGPVLGVVELEHLSPDLLERKSWEKPNASMNPNPVPVHPCPQIVENELRNRIASLFKQGLGPRKIAKLLKAEGIAIEYYQVAYRLKNMKDKLTNQAADC